MKIITTSETVSTNGMYYAMAQDVADRSIAHMQLGFDPLCLAVRRSVLFRSVQQETFDRKKAGLTDTRFNRSSSELIQPVAGRFSSCSR
jgi:hypothetical protein